VPPAVPPRRTGTCTSSPLDALARHGGGCHRQTDLAIR
jgi:hypothetical protein